MKKWFFEDSKKFRPATRQEIEDTSDEAYDEYLELTPEMIERLQSGEVLTVDDFPDVYQVYLRLKK